MIHTCWMSQDKNEAVKGVVKKSGKKRKKGMKRGVHGFGLAWLHSHESQRGETLDSSPGRSVQCVRDATLKNVLYMWTKCPSCTVYLEGT